MTSRFMVIIMCITVSTIEAAECISAQQLRQNDENNQENAVEYTKLIGMRWTDKYGNQSFIDSEGVPKSQNIKSSENADDQQGEENLRQRAQIAKTSIRDLDRNPIGNPKRSLALVMMAQRNIPSRMRIPEELHRIIRQYLDYDEIWTLFQMFTSPKDKTAVFGFESYEAMKRYLPTRAGQVAFLKSSRTRLESDYHLRVFFVQRDVYINKIVITPHPGIRPEGRRTFNWNAVAQLAHLEYLDVEALNINVSMDNIRKLPDTLRELYIERNHWTTASGDVDLSLLPRGLREFVASHCQGMNGVLKLDAPYSKLRRVDMAGTDVHTQINPSTRLPPLLMGIHLPRTSHVRTRELLRSKGIHTDGY